MSGDDHVVAARAVYDNAAQRYVEFVGTEISSTTEGPIDRALLVAFIELIKRQRDVRVADIGCGPGRVAALMAQHGLEVVGVDVSREMLAIARTAHPHIRFVEGQLDALPIESGMLAGAVCWYSIIYTPPDCLAEAFGELKRVLMPEGYVLLAFQAEGVPIHRADAQDTHLPLTSYRHGVHEVAVSLRDAGFRVYSTILREPELEHEATHQGFVFAQSSRSR
jgi:ubiquinone/menaquinone biosynthesis C-methylase UbiE